MATQKLLLNILGPDMYDLTDRELAIAKKVADWFDAPNGAGEGIQPSDMEFIEACKYALKQEGQTWEGIMLNRSRQKKVTEYRNAIALIVWRRIRGTQEYKSRLLGGMFTRATLIHAAKTASDWREYDPDYNKLYLRLTSSIDNYLKNTL